MSPSGKRANPRRLIDADTLAARCSNDDCGLPVGGSGDHIASRHERLRRAAKKTGPQPTKLGASRHLDLESLPR